MLRAEAGRDPHDRNLTDLVGELSTRSEDFRVRWAAHNVRAHQTGAKRFHHPVVGDLSLTYEMLELAADPGLHLLALSADIFAANRLGYAVYSEMDLAPGRPANHARFVFLDTRAKRFFLDWDRVADDTVAMLRAEAGRDPHDRDLTDLVGALSTRSQDFRVRWAAHNVRAHQTGAKRFHHPVVGDLSLTFEMLALAADPGLHLLALSAEPGTPSHDALKLLGSWAATVDPATARATNDA